MDDSEQQQIFDDTARLAAEVELGREVIDGLLTQLGEQLGIAGLGLDEHGIAQLTVDDDIAITLAHQPGFPGLIASLPLPNEGPGCGALQRRLLQANASWQRSGGGAFLMTPGDKALLLARRISLAGSDVSRLATALTDFARQSRDWLREIDLFLDLFEEDEGDADSDSANHIDDQRPAANFMRV